MKRRTYIVYGAVLLTWALILAWQAIEHSRVTRASRQALINRARDITTSLGLVIRSQRRFGTVSQDRLESALNELIKSGDVQSVLLLNASGAVVTSAGEPVPHSVTNNLRTAEIWDHHTVALVNPVDLGTVIQDGDSSQPIIVLPRRDGSGDTNAWRGGPPPWWRPPSRAALNETNEPGQPRSAERVGPPLPPGSTDGGTPREGRRPSARPPWMSEEEFKNIVARQGLHSFIVVMSTDSLRAAQTYDLWLRVVIAALASTAASGMALAWRNLTKSADLQVRLVRASELNKHLAEMNLAAAGLAHETRNPLNIIRGHAQLLSRHPQASTEVCLKTREITDEVDRVTARLNDFINYSKPREVRPAAVALGATIRDVARALQYDLEDKRVNLETRECEATVEADEGQLRQLLFNLLLNAVQAVEPGGKIEVGTYPTGRGEVVLEVRDNGPGVDPSQREEIFKPYFTTHQKGTGLGLAVVQQIVLAHGWEIRCLDNEPRGAIFEVSRMRLVSVA